MCGVARHARACYGGRLWPRRLASRMREVSTTPRASKYLRCSTLLSHVAAAAVPHAADAATPRATRDAGRAARDESRDSIFACGATSVGGRHYQRTSVHSFCSAGFRRATSRFCVPAFAPARNAAYFGRINWLLACFSSIGGFATRQSWRAWSLQVRRPGLRDVSAPRGRRLCQVYARRNDLLYVQV